MEPALEQRSKRMENSVISVEKERVKEIMDIVKEYRKILALPHLPPGHNAERTIMGNEIYFMGIDIGTYTGKGVITDSHGKVAARAEIAHGMENPAPGFYEHDAEAVWWHDFCFLSNS